MKFLRLVRLVRIGDMKVRVCKAIDDYAYHSDFAEISGWYTEYLARRKRIL